MEHLTIRRLWEVARQSAQWDAPGQEHLKSCPECAKLFDLLKAEGERGPEGLGKPEWGCPPEETVAALLAGNVAEAEAAKAREHLLACRWCLRAVMDLLSKQGTPTALPPPSPPAEPAKPADVAVFVTDESQLEDETDAEAEAAATEQEIVVEQMAAPPVDSSAAPTAFEMPHPVQKSALRRFWPHLLSIAALAVVLALVSIRGFSTPEARVARAIQRADALAAKGHVRDARSALETALGRTDLAASHVEQLRSAMERCFLQATDPNELNEAVEKGYASPAVLSKLAKAVAEGKATVSATKGGLQVAKLVKDARSATSKASEDMADAVVQKMLSLRAPRVQPTISADKAMADLLVLRAERKADLGFLRVSAKCLISAGLPQEAIQRLKAIVEKLPDDRAARGELAALYWQLGLKQELKDEIAALLELS